MSSDDSLSPQHVDKGKARAATTPDLTERTPLLAASTSNFDDDEPPPRRHLCSNLLSVFLISLSLCILLFVVIALIAYSYGSQASGIPPDVLIQRALSIRGPDGINVMKISREEGIWLKVKGRVGVDAGAVIGVNSAEEDNLFQEMWKSIGRWSIQRLESVSVNLSTIDISSEHDYLASIEIPPLDMPLTTNPPKDGSWLTEVTVPVLIRPTKDSSALLRFVRESWRNGMVHVKSEVRVADISGGHVKEDSWRKFFHLTKSDITSTIRMKLSPIPGLPPPGHDIPTSSLVTLLSFLISSTPEHLAIQATATVINPLPSSIHATIPSLPFTIHLVSNTSEQIPIASVATSPFTLTHPNITLDMTGHVLPLPSNASTTFSSFLSNYLSSRDSPIVVSTPYLSNLTLPAIFPAPNPRPHILRNVTIRDMKIKPTASGEMVASGTVWARVVMPKGIKVGLTVARVFPDILVFDGEVPTTESDDHPLPPESPLPDPLPERAFAHIRPDDWLVANSEPVVGDEDDGSVVEVTAKVNEVPLEVLPGRDKEFRSFVGKVIFGSHGALAGVQGVAAVAVRVQGLPFENNEGGEMQLEGLPFQGSVRIGKKSLLHMGSHSWIHKTLHS